MQFVRESESRQRRLAAQSFISAMHLICLAAALALHCSSALVISRASIGGDAMLMNRHELQAKKAFERTVLVQAASKHSSGADRAHSKIDTNLKSHAAKALMTDAETPSSSKPSTPKRRRPRTMPESGDPTMSLRNSRVAQSAAKAYSPSNPHSLLDFAGLLEESMTEQSDHHFKSLDTCPALVLNADFQPLSWIPLSLWSWQDAMKAVFADKVVVVATYDEEVRSASFSMRLPSVIALKTYVNQGKKLPSFTRRNVYLRDSYSCQYCGSHLPSHLLTFDHVFPRSQGGRTSWSNVVTACHPCNSKKKDYHLSEIERFGMKLLRTPKTPNFFELQSAARKFPPKVMHPTWRDYLTWDAAEAE